MATTPLIPEAGQRNGLSLVGAPQYPFLPMAANRKVITNTAALQAAGIRASLTGSDPPGEASDLTAAGARFVVKPDAAGLMALVFALGRSDAGDPNNRMAQFRVRGYSEIRAAGRRQWSATTLLDGYIVAGDAAVHGGCLLCPAGTTDSDLPSGYDVNWVDTIGVNNDYTLGDSARVLYDAADGRAVLAFDFGSHPFVEIEMTCLTDGSHGTAAGLATGAWSVL